MDKANSVVCIGETHEQAQRAIGNLQAAGIDMRMLSVATRDVSSDSHLGDDYNVGDQTFCIAGLGPLLVSGPLATWIDTAYDNGAGGGRVSIVGAGLATLGIPHASILQYEAALRSGKYLLVLHDLPNAVAKALEIIGGTTHCFHTIHGEKVYDTVHGFSLLAKTPAYTYQA